MEPEPVDRVHYSASPKGPELDISRELDTAFEPGPVLMLARDPAVIDATHRAAQGIRRGPVLAMASGEEALARLAAPGGGDRPGGHLVCEPDAAGTSWPDLLATLSEPSIRTALVVVSTAAPGSLHAGLRALPPDPG